MQRERPSVEVRERIEAMILSRGLGPEDRLPTERELAQQWGVARSTVRSAMRRLIAEGRVVTRQGSGSYVAPTKVTRNLRDLRPLALTAVEAGRELTTTVLAVQVTGASAAVADLLDLDPDEPVVQLRRLRVIDGTPASVEMSHLPAQRFPGLAGQDLTARSLYEVLAREFDTVVSRGYQRLVVQACPDPVAEELSVPAGRVMFRVRGLARDTGGNPVEQYESWVRHESIRFASQLEEMAET